MQMGLREGLLAPLMVMSRTYYTRESLGWVPRKPGLCLLPVSLVVSLVFTFGSFRYVTV